MTIDVIPAFLDENMGQLSNIHSVPVQIGDVVMAWRSPAVFSFGEITDIQYGEGFEPSAVTCRDISTGETIVNALSVVQQMSVGMLTSVVHSYVDNWHTTPADEQLTNLLRIARLLEPFARADRLALMDAQ